jgi:hypothetical protein
LGFFPRDASGGFGMHSPVVRAFGADGQAGIRGNRGQFRLARELFVFRGGILRRAKRRAPQDDSSSWMTVLLGGARRRNPQPRSGKSAILGWASGPVRGLNSLLIRGWLSSRGSFVARRTRSSG